MLTGMKRSIWAANLPPYMIIIKRYGTVCTVSRRLVKSFAVNGNENESKQVGVPKKRILQGKTRYEEKKERKKADTVDFVKKQVPVPCAFARRLIGNTRETGTSSE